VHSIEVNPRTGGIFALVSSTMVTLQGNVCLCYLLCTGGPGKCNSGCTGVTVLHALPRWYLLAMVSGIPSCHASMCALLSLKQVCSIPQCVFGASNCPTVIGPKPSPLEHAVLGPFLCMHVYTRLYTYVCTRPKYVHMYVIRRGYIHIYVPPSTHVHMYVCGSKYVHMYVFSTAHTYIWTLTPGIHVRTHADPNTYICTYSGQVHTHVPTLAKYVHMYASGHTMLRSLTQAVQAAKCTSDHLHVSPAAAHRLDLAACPVAISLWEA
jgi:hypothetical protein